jgi:hypothetical protein
MLTAIFLLTTSLFQVQNDTITFINSLEVLEKAQNMDESTGLDLVEIQL